MLAITFVFRATLRTSGRILSEQKHQIKTSNCTTPTQVRDIVMLERFTVSVTHQHFYLVFCEYFIDFH